MKILVTGANGLVGREVVKLLRQKNIEAIEYSRENGLDITDTEKLAQMVKGCEAVVHLAAELDENTPRDTMWKTNVTGTQNVVDACAKHKTGRLLFMSTAGVYGNTTGPKNEETPPAPQTAYEQSKLEAEKIVIASQELVPYTILRSALVIGPNAYWRQITQLVQRDFPLMGPSENAWQTIYYKDLANAIVFFLFLDTVENETVVIASEETPALLEVVQTLRSQLGMKNPPRIVAGWMVPFVQFAAAVYFALKGKQNLLSGAHLQRLARDRQYDLTKQHAYGWKAKYAYQQALKETVVELRSKAN